MFVSDSYIVITKPQPDDYVTKRNVIFQAPLLEEEGGYCRINVKQNASSAVDRDGYLMVTSPSVQQRNIVSAHGSDSLLAVDKEGNLKLNIPKAQQANSGLVNRSGSLLAVDKEGYLVFILPRAQQENGDLDNQQK